MLMNAQYKKVQFVTILTKSGSRRVLQAILVVISLKYIVIGELC